jgi:hypothetical protein
MSILLDLSTHQIDFTSAFVQADIDADVYVGKLWMMLLVFLVSILSDILMAELHSKD